MDSLTGGGVGDVLGFAHWRVEVDGAMREGMAHWSVCGGSHVGVNCNCGSDERASLWVPMAESDRRRGEIKHGDDDDDDRVMIKALIACA